MTVPVWPCCGMSRIFISYWFRANCTTIFGKLFCSVYYKGAYIYDYDLAVPFWDMYSKINSYICALKDIYKKVHNGIPITGNNLDVIYRQMHKCISIYSYDHFYKEERINEWFLYLTGWMTVTGIRLRERNHMQKYADQIIPFIYKFQND